MVAFGMILPSLPGNIGVFHRVIMRTLLLFCSDKEQVFVILQYLILLIYYQVLFWFLAFLKIKILALYYYNNTLLSR
jgi:hypothetical protein